LITDSSYEPEIAVTGDAWLGKGIGSIERLIRDTFSKPADEIQIATYSITEGTGEFFELLDGALTRNTRVMMIVNRFYSQPESVQKKLLEFQILHKDYFILRNFEPKDTREDLHAKLIVINHNTALVGSANLTWKGMVANHELMVKLSGKTANSVGELVDKLYKHRDSKPIKMESQ